MVVIVGYGGRQVRSGADWRRRRRQDAVFPQIPSGAAERHDSSKNAQFRRETTNRGEDRREGVGKPACVPFAGFRVELSDCMPSPRAKVHVIYSCLPDPCTCSPHPISIPPPPPALVYGGSQVIGGRCDGEPVPLSQQGALGTPFAGLLSPTSRGGTPSRATSVPDPPGGSRILQEPSGRPTCRDADGGSPNLRSGAWSFPRTL